MKKVLVVTMILIMVVSCMVGCGSTKVYGVGDTWKVKGQWELTVNDVKVTDNRSDYNPDKVEQVVVVKYTYKNIGFEDSKGLLDGLHIDLGYGVIEDAKGNPANPYISELDRYPLPVQVGESCEVVMSFAVNDKDNDALNITLVEEDGSGTERQAIFKLKY